MCPEIEDGEANFYQNRGILFVIRSYKIIMVYTSLTDICVCGSSFPFRFLFGPLPSYYTLITWASWTPHTPLSRLFVQ